MYAIQEGKRKKEGKGETDKKKRDSRKKKRESFRSNFCKRDTRGDGRERERERERERDEREASIHEEDEVVGTIPATGKYERAPLEW